MFFWTESTKINVDDENLVRHCYSDRIINLRFLYWGKSNSPVPLIASFLTDLEDFLNVKDFEVVVQVHHFVLMHHCYDVPCLGCSVVV